jgi:hypothetical protein
MVVVDFKGNGGRGRTDQHDARRRPLPSIRALTPSARPDSVAAVEPEDLLWSFDQDGDPPEAVPAQYLPGIVMVPMATYAPWYRVRSDRPRLLGRPTRSRRTCR